MSQSEKSSEPLVRAVRALRARFSLAQDRASDADIDQRIRTDVEMRGTNLWVLMFAIFIASIGLNVNSIAVIVGAMLISPLMGPIMGIGFGVGTFDLKLVRAGLINLGIASLIALVASAAYFTITPLRVAHSELLARTSPTIWDVLVALFGGLAGIVAATRRRQSNVVPGVAIATALMPPLCAAGYGLASGTVSYFFGAFYLFTINCVFIAASAAFVTRALRVHPGESVDPALERRIHVTLWVVIAVTMLPSIYLAYRLVGEEVFRTRAAAFVNRELDFPGTRVSDLAIDPHAHRIEASLIGNIVPAPRLDEVRARLSSAGLGKAELRIFQAGNREVDVASLRSGLLSDLYRDSQASNAQKDATIARLQTELADFKAGANLYDAVPAELQAMYPQVDAVLLAKARPWSADNEPSEQTALLLLGARTDISRSDQERIERWLRTRTGVNQAIVIVRRPWEPRKEAKLAAR